MARPESLSRRERQIMDVLYRLERATAAEVQAGLPDAPSYSAVRTLLRVLEEKGHIRHTQDGPRYVYSTIQPRPRAARTALGCGGCRSIRRSAPPDPTRIWLLCRRRWTTAPSR